METLEDFSWLDALFQNEDEILGEKESPIVTPFCGPERDISRLEPIDLWLSEQPNLLTDQTPREETALCKIEMTNDELSFQTIPPEPFIQLPPEFLVKQDEDAQLEKGVKQGACVRCSRAKVKCEGGRPCLRCQRLQIPCQTKPWKRLRKNQEDEERMRQLATTVQERYRTQAFYRRRAILQMYNLH